MAKMNLKEAIGKNTLILDGAMGTELFVRGVEAGQCNEYLNIEKPDIVYDVQRAYVEAGSDIIITNTFGANAISLDRHGFGSRAVEINRAGAEISRRAAGEDRYVLGDIGPCGDFLEPLGILTKEKLKEAISEQVRGLLEGGVDGFIVETMTALEEIIAAIEAVKSVSDLPVFGSMAFDPAGEDFRTMMGVDVKSAVRAINAAGADAVGFNCGTVTLDGYVRLAEKYTEAADGLGLVLFAEMNAGLPELVDGMAVYKVGDEEFADTAKKIKALGFSILGGCCGTSPEHIKALAGKLK
ncbi:MAG: homocysteine S-methyltransferase family protein [Phycisphaerae bacterium]|nr:homocysteine S-methyltransferase family protein [Phycisphaerae bacterium]